MLFKLLDEVVARINSLHPERDREVLLPHLETIKSMLDQMAGAGAPPDVVREVGLTLAGSALATIKKIPGMVTVMADALHEDRVDGGLACGMAVTLAYLVQPRDLIPDHLPGGFGFVDDYVLLGTAQLELLNMQRGPAAEVEALRKSVSMMGSLVPVTIRPRLQAAVDALSKVIQVMRSLPFFAQSIMLQTIITNPLAGANVQPSPGFMPSAGFSVSGLMPGLSWQGQNTWRQGDRIGVIFPGGGGVVADGRSVFAI